MENWNGKGNGAMVLLRPWLTGGVAIGVVDMVMRAYARFSYRCRSHRYLKCTLSIEEPIHIEGL